MKKVTDFWIFWKNLLDLIYFAGLTDNAAPRLAMPRPALSWGHAGSIYDGFLRHQVLSTGVIILHRCRLSLAVALLKFSISISPPRSPNCASPLLGRSGFISLLFQARDWLLFVFSFTVPSVFSFTGSSAPITLQLCFSSLLGVALVAF